MCELPSVTSFADVTKTIVVVKVSPWTWPMGEQFSSMSFADIVQVLIWLFVFRRPCMREGFSLTAVMHVVLIVNLVLCLRGTQKAGACQFKGFCRRCSRMSSSLKLQRKRNFSWYRFGAWYWPIFRIFWEQENYTSGRQYCALRYFLFRRYFQQFTVAPDWKLYFSIYEAEYLCDTICLSSLFPSFSSSESIYRINMHSSSPLAVITAAPLNCVDY